MWAYHIQSSIIVDWCILVSIHSSRCCVYSSDVFPKSEFNNQVQTPPATVSSYRLQVNMHPALLAILSEPMKGPHI